MSHIGICLGCATGWQLRGSDALWQGASPFILCVPMCMCRSEELVLALRWVWDSALLCLYCWQLHTQEQQQPPCRRNLGWQICTAGPQFSVRSGVWMPVSQLHSKLFKHEPASQSLLCFLKPWSLSKPCSSHFWSLKKKSISCQEKGQVLKVTLSPESEFRRWADSLREEW